MALYAIEQDIHPPKWWQRRPLDQRLADLRIPKRFAKCEFSSLSDPLPTMLGSEVTVAKVCMDWADTWNQRKKDTSIGEGIVLTETADEDAIKHLVATMWATVETTDATGYFTSANDLIESYWYGKRDTDTRIVDPHCLYNCRLTWRILLITHLGSEPRTEFSGDIVTSVIQSRFNHCLPTLITTPLNEDELLRRYGAPLTQMLLSNNFVIPFRRS